MKSICAETIYAQLKMAKL